MLGRIFAASLLLAASAGAGGAAPLLISVDFGETGEGSAYSGVEAHAAAANSLFAAADTWNFVTREFVLPPDDGPPSYALVDAAGATTGVTLHLSPVSGWSGDDALRGDYIYWTEGEEVEWSLTGLTPGAAYAFYAYSSDWPLGFGDRSFDLTIGSETQEVRSYASSGTHFAHLLADASGVISGVAGVPRPELLPEANWAGFQLAAIPAAIPLPASLLLLLSGLAALGGLRAVRSRRRIDCGEDMRAA